MTVKGEQEKVKAEVDEREKAITAGEKKAAREREKAAEKVRALEDELRASQEREAVKRVTHQPAVVHEDVLVDDVKVGEVHAVGGRVFVSVNGSFAQADMFGFKQLLERAFQAVS